MEFGSIAKFFYNKHYIHNMKYYVLYNIYIIIYYVLYCLYISIMFANTDVVACSRCDAAFSFFRLYKVIKAKFCNVLSDGVIVLSEDWQRSTF